MNTPNTLPQKPNSYKTVVTDSTTDKHLAEWVSTTPRTDADRAAIAADMYVVLAAVVGVE